MMIGDICVKKKKILIEGMTSNLGGLETFIHLLYSVLKESWQIDFITLDENIPFEREFLNQGCKIYRITSRYKNIKKYCKNIDQIFLNENYDVFWSNKTTLSSIYSLKMAKKYGVSKIICHSHASKNMGSFFTLCMHKFNRMRINYYIDSKVACSEIAADWFFGKNNKDVIILENAVDLSKYDPNPIKKEHMRKQLRIKENFVIGHIGRFSKEKNHKFLIELFSSLLEKVDAHLVLCGDGELKEEVEEQIKSHNIENKVSILGIRDDVPDVLQAIDVFVFPSLFEGLPFALVEAQAAGVPCIVSNTVSSEANLTDIVEFISLEIPSEVWIKNIIKYKDYKKIAKKEILREKGFSIDSYICKVKQIIS